MPDKNIYEDFERMFAEAEAKKAEYLEAQRKLMLLAPEVLDRAGEPTEPVDVANVVSQLGRGLSVDRIEVADPRLTKEKIRSYEGEFSAEVDKNAARIRRVVALAAGLALKGVPGL